MHEPNAEQPVIAGPAVGGRRARLAGRLTRRLGAYGVTGFAGLTLLVGQCAPATQCAPAPAAVAPALSPELQQVVDITNQYRTDNGLAPLVVNQALVNAAQAHSADQAARDVMDHIGSDGSNAGVRITRQGFAWSAWGENVAAGYRDAPSVTSGWWNSPPHQENILNGSYTVIGVGLAYAADGTAYWTQDFARGR